ncbi:MAG: PilZ domain-containing protein [Novosphingobium sp.]
MDNGSAGQEPPEQNFDDLREAPRFSLIIRSAKLVCESGEYLCVVRDISATGARLRLFHEPPPERHVFLELSNGDRHVMERVWVADGHAGFRIAQPIDVNVFLVEPSPFPKRPIRLRIQRPAVLTVGGVRHPATLIDLSQKGARITADCHLAVFQQIVLDIPGIGAIPAKVRWRGKGGYGLVLEHTFRLDDLASFAFDLQNSGTSTEPPHTNPGGLRGLG